MLGRNLITKQTGSKGRRCDKVCKVDTVVFVVIVLSSGLDSGEDEALVRILLCSCDG